VKSLPEEERKRLIEKARDYINRVPILKGDHTDHPVSTSHPVLTKEGNKEALLLNNGEWSKTEGVPCPALGAEGECTIYEARPVICRRFGEPIYDYKNPDNVYACDLNFKDGDEITDPLLIPNQTEIGKKWDEIKEKFNETALPNGLPPEALAQGWTTIAEAIGESEK
jgi:Fe-S-cluster containining protein